MGEKRAVDVLVIGSGGAGLRAAVEAARAGCSTLVLSKGKVNRSGASLLAGANISADIECDGNSLYEMGFPEAGKDDSKNAWFEEIVHQGMFLNNQKLVEIYVDDAPDRVRELLDWGLRVSRLESARGISVSSKELLDVLMQQVKDAGVLWENNVEAVDLLTADGRVNGALGMRVITGELVTYTAKAVILATGGWHSLYPLNSGSTDLTGDGHAMAYRAGAELINMEMVTFCPDTVISPRRWQGSIVPYVLHTTGYGHVLNKKGEEFFDAYFDRDLMNLALHTEWNKLLVSFAEAIEIEKEGTENHGLYFSMKHCPNELFDSLARELPGLKKSYAEMMSRLESGFSLEIAPAAEYFEGGIKVDERYQTTLPGLFAAGECSGGTFGSNRVSAATTEMLVHGSRAGRNAAAFAAQAGTAPEDDAGVARLREEIEAPLTRSRGASPASLRKELGELAEKHVSLTRTAEGLQEVATRVRAVHAALGGEVSFAMQTRLYNLEWLEYLALRNLADVLEASAASAAMRTESRGVHHRADYPDTDDDSWLKCITVGKDRSGMRFQCEPVVATRVALPSGRSLYQDYIKRLAARYA